MYPDIKFEAAIKKRQSLVEKSEALRNYYKSGATKTLAYRKKQLLKLKDCIIRYELHLYDALYADLKKNREEAWITELGLCIAEINTTLKNLQKWMRPEKVRTNLLNFPSSGFVLREPLGVVLIIAPWNYPFQLLFMPLIGAIAAGNCAVVKPSEFAPFTEAVMKKIIEESFPDEYVLYTEGDGAAIVPEMMNNFVFDHVFYTGSTATGRIIYQMAAKKLVPVTLELGGKSPCVIESDANITVAAKRIASIKFSNAGQMCVAPDYLLVHSSIKGKFIRSLKEAITQFYIKDAAAKKAYGKIINEKQFDRLIAYLSEGDIIFGGNYNKAELYIEPTIMDNVPLNSALMQQEIFGPLLPVFSFQNSQEALEIIEKNNNPLAFYIFTESKSKEQEWLSKVPAGGSCVNNAGMQVTNHYLPFGGRGKSGTGNYHGKYSFETFSHKKAVLKTPTWFDPAFKYPPFDGKLNILKKVVR